MKAKLQIVWQWLMFLEEKMERETEMNRILISSLENIKLSMFRAKIRILILDVFKVSKRWRNMAGSILNIHENSANYDFKLKITYLPN